MSSPNPSQAGILARRRLAARARLASKSGKKTPEALSSNADSRTRSHRQRRKITIDSPLGNDRSCRGNKNGRRRENVAISRSAAGADGNVRIARFDLIGRESPIISLESLHFCRSAEVCVRKKGWNSRQTLQRSARNVAKTRNHIGPHGYRP